MDRAILIITIASLTFAGGVSQAQASCNGTMDLGAGYAYVNVQIDRYLGMTCARAVRIGGAAYSLPGLRPIFGPQFGGGGYGGPFHVGHLYCWLDSRGSDFRNAACWHGKGRKREYVKFYDHRDYYMTTRAMRSFASFEIVARSVITRHSRPRSR
ncbi:MAG TPA: hypothetical protein VMU39_00730 [Solirubrobacteraceae bacterium]|nr:hypothetical protein [Solirubrobacteraceae bacterium]